MRSEDGGEDLRGVVPDGVSVGYDDGFEIQIEDGNERMSKGSFIFDHEAIEATHGGTGADAG